MATSYITNAALAQQITDLLNKWQTRETQMQVWIGGTSTGGPFADGRYPLTDVLSNTVLTPSPAALVSGVGVSVTAATAQAVLAAASATAAAGSATAAAASATAAATSLTNATAQAVAAASSSSNAAGSKALAQTAANTATTQAAAAVVSAAAALASQTAAAGSATAAAASATAAAGSATAAAASAVLAATFVPALYALLTGAAFTGRATISATGGSLATAPLGLVCGSADFAASFSDGTNTVGFIGFAGGTHAMQIGSAGAFGVQLIAGNVAVLNITAAGAATFSSTLAASNLSGTNTGDQNLAPYALLTGAAFTGQVSNSASFYQSDATGATIALAMNSTGADFGQIFNVGTQKWALGHGPSPGSPGTAVLTWDASGNVAIGGVNIKQSGSFTGTLATGFTGAPTGTLKWVSDGQMGTLYAAAAIVSTSINGVMTLTGLPAAMIPVSNAQVRCIIQSGGTMSTGLASLTAASGTITFQLEAGGAYGVFASTGGKGLPAGFSITYSLI